MNVAVCNNELSDMILYQIHYMSSLPYAIHVQCTSYSHIPIVYYVLITIAHTNRSHRYIEYIDILEYCI